MIPRIDYVVVAYRSEDDLAACLDSIAGDRPADAGIIVVDNASPDRSAEVARAHRSRPDVITSPRNAGFGGGCNLAADRSTADVLFFVNPDARVAAGTTEVLAGSLCREGNIVAAGPLVVDPEHSLRAASAGFEPSIRSVLGHFLLLARVPLLARLFPPFQLGPKRVAATVDWVSGAALAVRADAFGRIGGFDPSMFLYMEDVDLCRRLREAGGNVRYEPSAVVEHKLGGSQGPEQAERWVAAFHEYVARRRGAAYARVTTAIVAVGLALRAAVLIPSSPSHGTRLGRAARAAARLAVRPRGPGPARLAA